LRKVGPAGAVAGLYMQTDKQTGPFKSPAGIAATLRGVVAIEAAFTAGELDFLNANPSPVNAIRSLPGAGVVVMGARTLKNDGSANKYVNMRRSLIFLKKSLNDLTQFALFENNDERLWARLRASISVFLTGYWNQGGLRGNLSADAFFIKCDAENNPAEDIASGEVHIEIGVALQYPAEFVVINLSQKTSA
jgi:phage tail sheath protein FI